ncbi:MAG: glutathione S-transferase family protein [Cyanobacteria bacterium P01_A01_bin.15]
MIKLYHHPMTRSLRVLWLLEELGLAYSLETPDLCLPAEGKIFAQETPMGRFPTMEDGPITMCESGAIVEYLIERYGGGHFAPPKDSPLRAKYLQWLHFPEGTISPYLSAIHRFEKLLPETAIVMKKELDIAIEFVDQALSNSQYIVGEDFTGADIMLTVSLLSVNVLGLLDDKHTNITAYLQRLQSRPVCRKMLNLHRGETVS